MSFGQVTARAAYSGLLCLLSPLYLARVVWRGRAEPLYARSWPERFGWYRLPKLKAATPKVWIHAVSLGETRAATALVQALRQAIPDMQLLLTHTTATGREAGQALLRPGDCQTWFPYDTPGAARRFLRYFRPHIGILMETEVWPNMQAQAAKLQVPMVLANARLSEKSLRRGAYFSALLRPARQRLALTLAQTQTDAARLELAGTQLIKVTGNLKFDMTPDAVLLERGRHWRTERALVLAASTRETEENELLAAWLALPSPRPRLLIVPRHPQRFDEVARLITQHGLSLSRRSQWLQALPDAQAAQADIWLGDSMGEMAAYYATADVALLGGSFAPLGGQNLIEAAACGCPLLMGPHTFNFEQAATWALEAGAAKRVQDWSQAVQAALGLLQDPAERQTMSQQAQLFSAAHQGAAQRMSQEIEYLLSQTWG